MAREAGGSAERPTWANWWRVGCGVESLHDLLRSRDIQVSLDDLLADALDADGYCADIGWRHHALVAVAQHRGVAGDVCPPLRAGDVIAAPARTNWLISVRAPEQFDDMTHLVHVRRSGEGVEILWPQGQLELGRRFTVAAGWLDARMTGRGMVFPSPE